MAGRSRLAILHPAERNNPLQVIMTVPEMNAHNTCENPDAI